MRDKIDIKGILSQSGLKVTRQRRAIFNVLQSAGCPLSALDIKAKLRDSDQVTIYRTLEQFTDIGLISKLNLVGRKAEYEYAAHHHHHAVCTECGFIEEMEGCLAPSVERIQKSAKKFSLITNHSMEFFGVCRACYTQ